MISDLILETRLSFSTILSARSFCSIFNVGDRKMGEYHAKTVTLALQVPTVAINGKIVDLLWEVFTWIADYSK